MQGQKIFLTDQCCDIGCHQISAKVVIAEEFQIKVFPKVEESAHGVGDQIAPDNLVKSEQYKRASSGHNYHDQGPGRHPNPETAVRA